MRAILICFALLLMLIVLTGCSAVTSVREYNLYMSD